MTHAELQKAIEGLQEAAAAVGEQALDPKRTLVDILFSPANVRQLVVDAIEASLVAVEAKIAVIRTIVR